MQNYRNNVMPYNAYRSPHASSRMNTHHMDTTRMDESCMDSRNNHEKKSLAMAYVPWQMWRDLYDAEKGFHCGTIFQELNLPFLGKGGIKR